MSEEKIIQKLDSIEQKVDKNTEILNNHSQKHADHEVRFEKITNKLFDHDDRFEKITNKLLDHDDRFEKITNKLLDHDDRFEKITNKLLDHDDRFEKMDQKMERFQRENLGMQDRMITILERLDQERIFTLERIKRIESEVAQHTQEIKEMKVQLNIS